MFYEKISLAQFFFTKLMLTPTKIYSLTLTMSLGLDVDAHITNNIVLWFFLECIQCTTSTIFGDLIMFSGLGK